MSGRRITVSSPTVETFGQHVHGGKVRRRTEPRKHLVRALKLESRALGITQRDACPSRNTRIRAARYGAPSRCQILNAHLAGSSTASERITLGERDRPAGVSRDRLEGVP